MDATIRIFGHHAALGLLICLTGCITVNRNPRDKDGNVRLSQFKKPQFRHGGKTYVFEFLESHAGVGATFWIPDAETLIPVGELGGPLIQEREPVFDHTVRVPISSRGMSDDTEYYINPDAVWNRIRSQYPGAQRIESNRAIAKARKLIRRNMTPGRP